MRTSKILIIMSTLDRLDRLEIKVEALRQFTMASVVNPTPKSGQVVKNPLPPKSDDPREQEMLDEFSKELNALFDQLKEMRRMASEE